MDEIETSVTTPSYNVMDKIQPFGISKSQCGYCHDPRGNTSILFGFTASSYSAEDYDTLMLHGWSRSGNYMYIPSNHTTCCPQYIIRLNTIQFSPSSSQRKTWRRFQKLLETKPSGNPPSLTITMERASFTTEKFALFKKYSIAVHGETNEDMKESSFIGFLVDSPMNSWLELHGDITSSPYGTFHQLYRNERGILIGVGVQDILPSGIISVYFFYDPEFKHMSLGRCSALYEIEYCRRHNHTSYYMGYYVHACSKMNYKKDYHPSEFLCPTTYKWVPVLEGIKYMDRFPFTPLVQPFVALRAAVDNHLRLLDDTEKIEKAKWAALKEEREVKDEDNDEANAEVDNDVENFEAIIESIQDAKAHLLQQLISIGSTKELPGIDCSIYEAWENQQSIDKLMPIISKIPLVIKTFDGFQFLTVDELRGLYTDQTCSRVIMILADLVRYLGWKEDTQLKYPVFFR